MDLDLRKLRYFAAVAEQQHFGRAAEQLHIAQPVLSRQIRALEHELGCVLFERTTRAVQLTPAGEALLEDAPRVLAASTSATRRAHRAARGTRRLVIGFAPGLSVSAAVRAFERENPGVGVDMQRLKWFEQGEALRDGRVDAGYLRRPFDSDGLRCITVGREPAVACLPATHPLARGLSLAADDLSGENVLDSGIRRTATVEEKFELVAAGRGIAVLPSSVAGYYSRPDLACLPITDADPVRAVRGGGGGPAPAAPAGVRQHCRCRAVRWRRRGSRRRRACRRSPAQRPVTAVRATPASAPAPLELGIAVYEGPWCRRSAAASSRGQEGCRTSPARRPAP